MRTSTTVLEILSATTAAITNAGFDEVDFDLESLTADTCKVGRSTFTFQGMGGSPRASLTIAWSYHATSPEWALTCNVAGHYTSDNACKPNLGQVTQDLVGQTIAKAQAQGYWKA